MFHSTFPNHQVPASKLCRVMNSSVLHCNPQPLSTHNDHFSSVQLNLTHCFHRSCTATINQVLTMHIYQYSVHRAAETIISKTFENLNCVFQASGHTRPVKFNSDHARKFLWHQQCSFNLPLCWRGTVVEHRSLTGELSLSCARPAADG